MTQQPEIRFVPLAAPLGASVVLTVGQDLSIGYTSHAATSVSLYLLESFTFRVLTPEAAVWLKYQS